MKSLVIGCGLSGASIARELAENGFKVKIVERRNHIGGNLFDYVDNHGILVHKYGPHTFHTNNPKLYDYICKFTKWKQYRLLCGAEINGRVTPTPFNFKTVDDYFSTEMAKLIKSELIKEFKGRKTVSVLEVLNSKIPAIREYGEFLFKNDYSLYTAKQWGVPPSLVDPSILKRVPLRLDYQEGYFDDKYQVMPETSYTKFFESLLDHENIEIELGVDALKHLKLDEKVKTVLWDNSELDIPVIYTGALDELFGCRYGSLPYRSLKFEWCYREDVENIQPYPVVAYPQAPAFTRIVEFKQLPMQNVDGTSYEVEYPIQYEKDLGLEPYYPVLTQESQKLYQTYRDLASLFKNLYCCGRLAEFKYYNMDQALEKSLEISKKILQTNRR